jgi:hypothetical protein
MSIEMFSSGSRGGHGRAGYLAHRGYAARRGGRGWGQNHEVSRVPSPPLGPVLSTISRVELVADEVPAGNAKITGVEDVASYNWISGKEPTILVPGKHNRRIAEDVLT